VLSAVFVPMAFFGGSTGVIYRQFSITIVSAMVLSVLVAIVLTPALCATLLKPVHKGEHGRRPENGSSAGSTLKFDRSTRATNRSVGKHLSSAACASSSSTSLIVAVLACSSCACRPPSCPRKTRA
jgi:multidrug efflux pump